jgi:hypothetical protein
LGKAVGGVTAGPGVFGRSEDGIGVMGRGSPAILADSVEGIAVLAQAVKGPGIEAHSKENQGGVFQSDKRAQIRLVPRGSGDPGQMATSEQGELAVTLTTDPRQPDVTVASLWFCTIGGIAGQSHWTKIA